MSSPSRDFLRSPFENVLQILPQGHDKALKQAFYNTAALLFVLFACGAAVAVYYILEPFLQPLLWAVLCGTFLFPFKCAVTGVARRWLRGLRQSGTPLVVGTALIPVKFVDSLSDRLGNFGWRNVGVAAKLSVALPIVYLVVYLYPIQVIYESAFTMFLFLYEALGYFNALWVWSLVASYLLLLIFFWTPERTVLFKIISLPVWMAASFHIASIVGPFRVPLVMLIIILICTGSMSALNRLRGNGSGDGSKCRDDASTSELKSFFDWLPARWRGSIQSDEGSVDRTLSSDESASPPSPPSLPLPPHCDEENSDKDLFHPSDVPFDASLNTAATDGSSAASDATATQATPCGACDDTAAEAAVDLKDGPSPSSTHLQQTSSCPRSSLKKTPPPTSLNTTGVGLRRSRGRAKDSGGGGRSLSDYCFICLFWSLGIVHLWLYNFVFLLLPLLLVSFGIKRLGEYLGLWHLLRTSARCRVGSIKERLVNDPRVNIILPSPVRQLGSWLLEGDHKINTTLDVSMDKIVSVFIIIFLVVGVALASIFSAMEIHRESMHLVHLTSDILNKTSHPEFAQWLPEQDAVQETLDNMVSNAYIHGREWISSKLRGLLTGDDASKEQIEKQVLKVFDKMYVSWFTKNKTAEARGMSLSRQLSLDLTEFSSPSDVIGKLRQLDLDVVGFARENVEVFLSVLKSIWAVVVSNIALTVKVLMSMLSLIFGGSSAIFNIVLSAIVFLTTLFYLLASSGMQYKPVEMFAGLSPPQRGSDVTFGKAFEDAIGSVFLASFKMAAFYGLYTWLTHTIFAIQIIFIPSALAAIFAAVPFLGTYMAALPAVIELWFIHGQKLQALLLFAAHYVPTLFVDTAIYSEIKGGHPYLTGLAIAGGMFWLGLQGAIIGPILLCCLIVAVNMYQTFLKVDTVDDTADKRTTLNDKRVKFNLTRGAISMLDVT